jgi:hypothetical protein
LLEDLWILDLAIDYLDELKIVSIQLLYLPPSHWFDLKGVVMKAFIIVL